MKKDYSACCDHDGFACARIPSKASGFLPNHKLSKAGDGNRLPSLKSGFEEFKNPIQQRGRFFFRDPRFLMNTLSNVLLLHLVLFRLRQQALAFHFWPVSLAGTR
jgi:hypothetical protein